MDTILVFVALVVIIGVLVFVHELGHFLAAKLTGVTVEEFALGFGPQLFSRPFKGTLYRINLLPLGGYVKLKGETDEAEGKAPEPDAYYAKPLRSKLFILSAGVLMNILFACVLFTIYLPSVNYEISTRKEGNFQFVGTESTVELPPSLLVLQIEPQSPADGYIVPGDIIASLNDTPVQSDAQFRQFLADHAGQQIAVKLVSTSDNFSARSVNITLRKANTDNKPLLGVGASYDENAYFIIKYPHTITSAFAHAYNMFFYQIAALGSLIGQSVAKSDIKPLASEVGGLVAVAGVVNDLISIKDFLSLLNLTAVISLSLAFVNFLPIPLLDGGQAFIETVEALRGRKLSRKLMERINLVSLIFIALLFLAVTFKDIVQVGLISNVISGIRDVLGR